MYRYTNSGASFTCVDDGTKSMLYYNADGSGSNIGQGSYDLCIAISPTDANTVYIGGIYKTTNGGSSWLDLTNGIVTSQIYRIGASQTDANIVLTGLQEPRK